MKKKYIFIYVAVFAVGLTLGRVTSSVNSIPFSVLSTGTIESDDNRARGEKEVGGVLERFSGSPNDKNEEHGSVRTSSGLGDSRGAVVGESTKFQDLTYYAKQQSVESYIREKFENHADYQVVEFLQQYINVDDDDIPEGVSAVDFAARLGEIFTKDLGLGIQERGDHTALIEFDVVTDSEFQAVSPAEEFQPRDKKIYASFNTELYAESSVMVKWYRVDDPKVYVFDTYEINTEKNNNYIWLKKSSGWFEGNYGVEIYSMEDNLNLMAYGEYAVVRK